eukprot:s1681_g6.t1
MEPPRLTPSNSKQSRDDASLGVDRTAVEAQMGEWATYGAQLRAWVGLQVDEQLSRRVPGLMDARLSPISEALLDLKRGSAWMQSNHKVQLDAHWKDPGPKHPGKEQHRRALGHVMIQVLMPRLSLLATLGILGASILKD